MLVKYLKASAGYGSTHWLGWAHMDGCVYVCVWVFVCVCLYVIVDVGVSTVATMM